MRPYQEKPAAFFDLVIHDEACQPGLTGASGVMSKGSSATMSWQLPVDWLPEFALKYSELEEFNSGTAMRLVKAGSQDRLHHRQIQSAANLANYCFTRCSGRFRLRTGHQQNPTSQQTMRL